MSFNIDEIIFQAKQNDNFIKGNRNQINVVSFDNQKISVKIFKKPSFFLSLVYRYFRKSKARRSYEYAVYLSNNAIGTPKPIGYYENNTVFGLKDSYYLSEHLENVFMFRDIFESNTLPIEQIVRGLAKFTFQMHQCGIEFLDHSPGNTLIRENNGEFDFFLVDLNRMKIHKKELSFDRRMKNFERILPLKEYRQIVSNEYAKLYNKSYDEVFEAIEGYSVRFFKKFDTKKRIKNLFKLK